jgi:hypothetical protein
MAAKDKPGGLPEDKPDRPGKDPAARAARSAKRAQDVGAAFKGKRTTVATTAGDVTIAGLSVGTDDTCGWVDVQVDDGQSGESHFRVVNPPRYVEDPAGDIEINGKRFRDDPLAALAFTIAQNGGARRRRFR